MKVCSSMSFCLPGPEETGEPHDNADNGEGMAGFHCQNSQIKLHALHGEQL